MKIQPISTYKNNYSFKASNGIDYEDILLGKNYPSGRYSGFDIDIAERSLKLGEDWQDYVRVISEYLLDQEYNWFQMMFINTEKLHHDYIYRISKLRVDLLNEYIQKIKDEQANVFKETISNAITNKTKIMLKKKFITKIIGDSKDVPTAILISGKNKKAKEDILNWICEQSKSKYQIEEYDCPDDENRLMHYLDTQKDYSENRFKRSKVRTMLKLNGFDKHLKNDNPELKDFLYNLSEDKTPMTIIFETEDAKELSTPFIGNQRRIPIKIAMNEELIKDEIKTMMNFIPNQFGGYKYRINEEKFVNLYLGGFGFQKNVLWIDSKEVEDVKNIIKNIKAVKLLDKFKDVEFIECAIKDYSEVTGLKLTTRCTTDFKRISQYKIND